MTIRRVRVRVLAWSLSLLYVLCMCCSSNISYVNQHTYVNHHTYVDQKMDYFDKDIGKCLVVREKSNLNQEKEMEPNEDSVYRHKVFMANYRPIRNSADIDCKKIINNDHAEILKSNYIMRQSLYSKVNLTVDYYLNMTKHCAKFRYFRGYIEHPLSNIEHEFPVAFSILAYRDIEQVERLIRALYRPHNFYCIHIDSKMDMKEKLAIGKIAKCLKNVFIPEKSVNVVWGDFSLLEAELVCMRTLWNKAKQWKYYINLTGQEFPLKTNREIVSVLKVLDGANVIDGSVMSTMRGAAHRWSGVKSPPPHNIEPVKGSMHIAANRDFVDFCLHDQRSLDFIEWLKQTSIPDETLFSSLNHNPHLGIRRSFFGDAKHNYTLPHFLRYVIWNGTGVNDCHGQFVRQVCVLGVRDLYMAYNSIFLFANKFYLDFEPIALDCLEELLYEKTWKEYIEDIPVNTSFYSQLDYARMQIKS